MPKKSLLCFFIVVLYSLNLNAQVENRSKVAISGIVLDSITHLPLEGTTIRSKLDEANAFTDSAGKFTIYLSLPNSIVWFGPL